MTVWCSSVQVIQPNYQGQKQHIPQIPEKSTKHTQGEDNKPVRSYQKDGLYFHKFDGES